jgi:hypothetical protein
MTSTLRVWRTLHTEGMYTYHIQRIQHLEPADMCSQLELCSWINSNHHTIRNLFSTTPTQGEHERRATPVYSQCCKKLQQRCSA